MIPGRAWRVADPVRMQTTLHRCIGHAETTGLSLAVRRVIIPKALYHTHPRIMQTAPVTEAIDLPDADPVQERE